MFSRTSTKQKVIAGGMVASLVVLGLVGSNNVVKAQNEVNPEKEFYNSLTPEEKQWFDKANAESKRFMDEADREWKAAQKNKNAEQVELSREIKKNTKIAQEQMEQEIIDQANRMGVNPDKILHPEKYEKKQKDELKEAQKEAEKKDESGIVDKVGLLFKNFWNWIWE